MKGAFYGRHSTDKQDMISQKNSVNNLMRKYNCEIVEEYLDPGVSAVKIPMEKREYLQKIISSAKEKKFDFIVAYKSDRLARDPHEHLTIRSIMADFDMPVIISSTEELYDKKKDLLVQLTEDGFTKFEADNIRIRTYDGKEAKAGNGSWLGGHPPFGYRYDTKNKDIEPIPHELSIVKQIFDLYKKGNGFQSIADIINTNTKGVIGSPSIKWAKKKVKDIILNPIYAGFVSWRKRTKGVLNDRSLWIVAPSDLITPIITKEEWEICYRLFNERRINQISPKYYKTSFLLYDIIQCKICKCKLETKDQRKEQNGKVYGERIYRCPSCNLRCSAEELHSTIVNEILVEVRFQTFDSIFNGVIEKLKIEVEFLNRQIEDLDNEQDKYVSISERIKDELHKLMKNKCDDRLIKSLYQYYLDVQRKIRDVKNTIENKNKEIQIKQDAKFNREAWTILIENILQDREQIDDMDIRRLFIPLIEYVTIDNNLKVDYKLRIDKSKRKMSNQIQLQF